METDGNNKAENKKFIKSWQTGYKGEAFFESLLSNWAIVHKIEGHKDLGLDFLCEWVYDENPTRVLFGIQVKTTSWEQVSIENEGKDPEHNNLLRARIFEHDSKTHKYSINNATLNYWSGFEFPIYLFVIIKNSDGNFNCYYKRYTPILHQATEKWQEKEREEYFFEANQSAIFLAFADPAKRVRGFARDLFIDYMRCNYFRGSLTYKNPQDFGLEQFSQNENTTFYDLYEEYRDRINATYKKYKSFFGFVKANQERKKITEDELTTLLIDEDL